MIYKVCDCARERGLWVYMRRVDLAIIYGYLGRPLAGYLLIYWRKGREGDLFNRSRRWFGAFCSFCAEGLRWEWIFLG